MRPLIGITTASYTDDHGRRYNRSYAPNAEAIAKAGGLPVYIPTNLDEATLRELYSRLDGILFPGGPDVDPSYYAAERHPLTVEIDHPRDALELPLVRWAASDDVPLLGICRGHQVINVALGGTLIQDIPSQVGSPLMHDLPDHQPRSERLHEIEIAPSSRLADLLGGTRFAVNSLHHQAVETPAPGVVVTAYAPDGVIEALELPDKRFAVSVQWHPEDLYDGDDAMQRLFKAFVESAAQYAGARG